MLGHITALFIPTLIQAQLPSSPAAQSDVKFLVSLYARPAVVRVVAGCYGTYSYNDNEYALVTGDVGSGTFIDPAGHIVTNAHVVWSGEETGCREHLLKRLIELTTGQINSGDISEQKIRDVRSRARLVTEVSYINRVVLPNGNSLPFEIGAVGEPIAGDRKDVAVIKIDVTNAPTLKLIDSSAKMPDSVISLGYFTEQDVGSFSSPILLKDVSLGKGLGIAKVLTGQPLNSTQSPDSSITLKFQETASSGIAGSPVLNDQSELVGMVTISDADLRQGSNAASVIPIETIQEFVKQTTSVNQENPINGLYREGLQAFDQKKFAKAKAKFEEVQQLFPNHSEAGWLISASDQKIAEVRGARKNLLRLIGLWTAPVAVLVGYILWKRQQRLKHNDAVSQPLPTPELVAVPVVAAKEEEPIAQPVAQSASTAIAQGVGSILSPATVVSTQPFIELKNQDGEVRRFYLKKDRHQLGRDRDWADFYVDDSGWEVLSRFHAVLERDGADYRIYDGDRQTPSTNGIFLNAVPITTHEGHLLQDGDELKIGDDPRSQVTFTYSNPGNRRPSH